MEESEVFTNLMSALQDYGDAAAEMYRNRLIGDGKVASGKLLDSVRAKVAYRGTEFVVFLELEDWWRYVEKGRKPGKWPPRDKILEWIRIKPVEPRPDKDGNLPTEEQLAFLIQRKIGTEGIEAGNQLAETLEDLNRQYLPILQQAIEKDFDAYLIKVHRDIGKMIRI